MTLVENLYYASVTISDIHFKVVSSGKGIRQIYLNQREKEFNHSSFTRLHPDDPYMFNVFRQLKEYFSLDRKEFTVPLDVQGTDFQLSVWDEVIKIPYGETVSYKHLADRINNPGSVRAVGRANGANPVPVIIPCHRVIGMNGSLTGYSGGLGLKERLLEMEGCISLELFSILHENHIEIIQDY
jgi:methylated-DNA-[protein]-cysteine S-methyltransferase